MLHIFQMMPEAPDGRNKQEFMCSISRISDKPKAQARETDFPLRVSYGVGESGASGTLVSSPCPVGSTRLEGALVVSVLSCPFLSRLATPPSVAYVSVAGPLSETHTSGSSAPRLLVVVC